MPDNGGFPFIMYLHLLYHTPKTGGNRKTAEIAKCFLGKLTKLKTVI